MPGNKERPSRIVLTTDRLRLRTWNGSYGRLLNRHCNNPAVLKHLGGSQMSAKEHREMLEWLNWQEQTFGTTFWAIERIEDDEFLGFCGLVFVDDEDSTVLGAIEIGWRLRSDAQGKGFAKEAAIACLGYAFDELNALRVVSRTIPANQASWGLMRSLFMRPDPRLDYVAEDDPDETVLVHVLTYKDWERTGKRVRG